MKNRGTSKGTLLLIGLCTAAILLAGFRNVGAGTQGSMMGAASIAADQQYSFAESAAQASSSQAVASSAGQAALPASAQVPSQESAPRETASAAGPSESLALLTTLGSDAALPGSPLRLVFKWQGEYSGAASAGDAAQSLAAKLGLGTASRADEEGHMTSRAAATLAGAHVADDASMICHKQG